jgi:excisionase family DNA binding protein
VDILTVKDAAGLLEVDQKTVYRLIELEGLPAFRVGRQWRLRLSDVEKWIDGQLQAREAEAVYRLKQAPLFLEQAAQVQEAEISFSDSAFTENGDLPVHRWVPWIAGYSARFVEDAIRRYIPQDREPAEFLVMDPFAGVGTTLVTAYLRGHSVAGFEINPYAAKACELKLSVDRLAAQELESGIGEFRRAVCARVAAGEAPQSTPPKGFISRRPFFSPQVERKVLLAWDHISGIADADLRRCFEVALAAELVSFSNYSYEPSLGTRIGAGKREVADAPVVDMIARKLAQMAHDVRAVQRAAPRWGQKRLFRGNLFEQETGLPAGSVDLVVTSPPYVNNYHYVRNTRPQLYWLGLTQSPDDLRAIEHGSFGKFWQTVRAGERVELEVPLPELQGQIEALRGRNAEKGTYGGNGWANYAATYLNDSLRLAQVLARVMKPGAAAVVVLGNSILQGIEFRTDALFGRICELCGLRLAGIELLRNKRTGTSIIQSSVRTDAAAEKTVLYESAVILKKR